MLIFSLVFTLCGIAYILRQAEVAEITAHWIKVSSEFMIRTLMAHAAGQRAARAAYRAEWQRRFEFNKLHEQADLFWTEIAAGMGERA
jgi:hypothetical protein